MLPSMIYKIDNNVFQTYLTQMKLKFIRNSIEIKDIFHNVIQNSKKNNQKARMNTNKNQIITYAFPLL